MMSRNLMLMTTETKLVFLKISSYSDWITESLLRKCANKLQTIALLNLALTDGAE